MLLVLPARITRRKNIEYGLRTLEALRRSTGLDCRLIVTGPPGAHNPTNASYLAELLELRTDLGIVASAHFLFQLDDESSTTIGPQTLAELYQLSDALFFPSHDEGFGIPLLEAGLARLPVFCSDIPPFHESGGDQVHYFSLQAAPIDTAHLIMRVLAIDPAHVLRRRVFQTYTWRDIVRRQVVPILERAGNG
jgi:glycosyltransferase involved in cell wall biosynthesis